MKCAHVAFSVVPKSVLGMPRIETEFEFHMVFCFGIHLAPYAVFFFFHSDLPSNTLHDLLKVIVL